MQTLLSLVPMQKYIQAVFEAGIYDELDEWEKRSVRLLNRLVFIAVCGTFAFALLDVFNGYYEATVVFFTVLLFGVIEQALVKRRKYLAAKLTLFGFILTWSVFFSVLVGTVSNPQYMILPLAMMPLLVFRSFTFSLVLFVLTILAFILTMYLQSITSPVIILSDNLKFLYTAVAAIMMMMVIFLLTLYSKSLTASFEKIIIRKNEQLSGAYKDIKDSITYAKRLQQAILPSESFIKTHLPESFILYKPKDIVAGDFYWFHTGQEASHSELLLAVADCTGHGVPGAMVSVVCSNALNRAVVELGISDPGKILDKVRELVIATFEAGNDEVKDGMDISLVSISKKSGSEQIDIKWAGANNPLWYISGNNFKEVKPDKQPIGKHINQKPFTTHSLRLNKGDTLFLFTDGYADQFGGPKGKKFKYKQLAEMLLNNTAASPDTQKRLLDQSFETWRGDHEQIDDVCVIGIKL